MKDLSIEILGENRLNEYKIAREEGDNTKAFYFIREAYILESNNIEIMEGYLRLSIWFNYIENARMLSKKLYERKNIQDVEDSSFLKISEFLESKIIYEYEDNLKRCFSHMDNGDYYKAYHIIKEIRKKIEETLFIIELLLIESLILINIKEFNEAGALLKEVLKKDKGNVKAKKYLRLINDNINGEGGEG